MQLLRAHIVLALNVFDRDAPEPFVSGAAVLAAPPLAVQQLEGRDDLVVEAWGPLELAVRERVVPERAVLGQGPRVACSAELVRVDCVASADELQVVLEVRGAALETVAEPLEFEALAAIEVRPWLPAAVLAPAG